MPRKRKFATQSPDIVRIFPRNQRQQRFIESIQTTPVTLGIGPAGVGKTLLALHEAVQMHHKRTIDKIIYIKPIVDLSYQKSIGFLPGTFEEKVDPLLAPVRDNLEVFCSKGKANQLINNKDIEVQLLEHIRGRSLRNTFVLVDESQNLCPLGVLTILSRAEESTKIVLCGDPRQRDNAKKYKDGLTDAAERLRHLQDVVGIVKFYPQDIQRSSYLIDIIEAYQQ